MKIEKIENNKIKVTLTMADLTLYDIDREGITPNSTNLHKFLFDIMERVKEETGFNPHGGQVVVEAIKTPEEFTLLISKLKHIGVSESKKKLLKEKKFTVKKREHKKRFEFKSFDNFCKAVSLVDDATLEHMTVFKYEGSWYVTVLCGGKSQYILGEYCDAQGEMVFGEVFLKEHGDIVSEGASTLTLAHGIKALD